MMETSIRMLLEKTTELVNRIDTTEYQEWSSLVELRESVLAEAMNKPGLSEEEKQLLRQIGEFDSVVTARMITLKQEAQSGLQKIRNTRMQKKAYQIDYTPDSFFYDIKK
ncbi:hypothetical protein ACFSL6_07105 [Paenibacillus thailandensis]|uniref:Flagellar protein FliT n=1 Tax=Paenibacillus thailandensis TaxID=393250 RepID=A0ABW5R2M4_9BACL